MLRVLHISERYPELHQEWGGAEAGCRAFLEAGEGEVENWLATLPPDRPEPATVPHHLAVATAAGGGAWSGFLARHSISDPRARRSVAKIIGEVKPEIVHIHRFAGLGWGVARAAIDSGTPTILSLYDCSLFCPRETLIRHDSTPCASFACGFCGTCSMPGNPRNWLRNCLWGIRARAMRKIAAAATRITVLSGTWLEKLEQFGVSAASRDVLPLPIRFWPDNEMAQARGTGRRILFVGWLQPRKGLHVLVEALALLRKRALDVTVDAVITGGEPDYEAEIRDRLVQLGLQGAVRMHGRMRPAQLRDLMRQARVVAVPEQWPNPQPVVLCEAMSFARRVVASNTGGIPGLLGCHGERGLLATADDPSDWARQLAVALASDDGSAQAAREFAGRQFTIEAVREHLLCLYRSIRQGSKP